VTEKVISTPEELFVLLGCEGEKEADKLVYGMTACGAHIIVTPGEITLHSIVEGSEAEVEVTRDFPFSESEFWAAMEDVDGQACLLWDEANGGGFE
jgi:hypothetical protein